MKHNKVWETLSGFVFRYTVVVSENSKITHNTSEKAANVDLRVYNVEMQRALSVVTVSTCNTTFYPLLFIVGATFISRAECIFRL
jgi:hypothetical protein